jgi:hypothetical protein
MSGPTGEPGAPCFSINNSILSFSEIMEVLSDRFASEIDWAEMQPAERRKLMDWGKKFHVEARKLQQKKVTDFLEKEELKRKRAEEEHKWGAIGKPRPDFPLKKPKCPGPAKQLCDKLPTYLVEGLHFTLYEILHFKGNALSHLQYDQFLEADWRFLGADRRSRWKRQARKIVDEEMARIRKEKAEEEVQKKKGRSEERKAFEFRISPATPFYDSRYGGIWYSVNGVEFSMSELLTLIRFEEWGKDNVDQSSTKSTPSSFSDEARSREAVAGFVYCANKLGERGKALFSPPSQGNADSDDSDSDDSSAESVKENLQPVPRRVEAKPAKERTIHAEDDVVLVESDEDDAVNIAKNIRGESQDEDQPLEGAGRRSGKRKKKGPTVETRPKAAKKMNIEAEVDVQRAESADEESEGGAANRRDEQPDDDDSWNVSIFDFFKTRMFREHFMCPWFRSLFIFNFFFCVHPVALIHAQVFNNLFLLFQGIPRVGDIVYYFMGGHRAMFPRSRYSPAFLNERFPWFFDHPELKARGHVLAEVKLARCRFMPMLMVSTVLNPINNETERRVTGEPFCFKFDPSLPRRFFVLPKSRVDRAIEQNLKVRGVWRISFLFSSSGRICVLIIFNDRSEHSRPKMIISNLEDFNSFMRAGEYLFEVQTDRVKTLNHTVCKIVCHPCSLQVGDRVKFRSHSCFGYIISRVPFNPQHKDSPYLCFFVSADCGVKKARVSPWDVVRVSEDDTRTCEGYESLNPSTARSNESAGSGPNGTSPVCVEILNRHYSPNCFDPFCRCGRPVSWAIKRFKSERM